MQYKESVITGENYIQLAFDLHNIDTWFCQRDQLF